MKLFKRSHRRHSHNGVSLDQHKNKDRRSRRNNRRKSISSSQTSGASQHVINQLMHVRLRETCKDMETCLICSEKHEIGNVVTILPCGHMFHSNCAVVWLKHCSTCPFCPQELTSDNDNSDNHDSVSDHFHEATIMIDGYSEEFKRTEPLEHDRLSLVQRVLRLQQEELLNG